MLVTGRSCHHDRRRNERRSQRRRASARDRRSCERAARRGAAALPRHGPSRAAGIDQEAAYRQPTMPIRLGDQDERDAAIARLRRRAGIAGPIIAPRDPEPLAPAGVDPAPRVIASLVCISGCGSRLSNDPDKPRRLALADRQRARDLSRRVPPRPQPANLLELLLIIHGPSSTPRAGRCTAEPTESAASSPRQESVLVSWPLSSWHKCGMLWYGENWTAQTGVGVD